MSHRGHCPNKTRPSNEILSLQITPKYRRTFYSEANLAFTLINAESLPSLRPLKAHCTVSSYVQKTLNLPWDLRDLDFQEDLYHPSFQLDQRGLVVP